MHRYLSVHCSMFYKINAYIYILFCKQFPATYIIISIRVCCLCSLHYHPFFVVLVIHMTSCLTDAILEHYADSSSLLKPDLDGLSSLVDFYNRRPNQPQQKLRRREPQTAVGGGGGIGAWSENRMAQLLGSAISTRFVWPSKRFGFARFFVCLC